MLLATRYPNFKGMFQEKMVLFKHLVQALNYCVILVSDPFSKVSTVCPGSSDPPEKIINIFASENEVYTIY